jgi:hypothetical protein
VELTELEVGLSPARVYPEDLAAERYGVVEEALIGVEVDRPLIGPDGFLIRPVEWPSGTLRWLFANPPFVPASAPCLSAFPDSCGSGLRRRKQR